MPSFERAPCDELVFDFPYQKKIFFCVCVCVWLWAMAFISILCMGIVRFLVRALRAGRGKAVLRLCGDGTARGPHEKGDAREGGNDRILEP